MKKRNYYHLIIALAIIAPNFSAVADEADAGEGARLPVIQPTPEQNQNMDELTYYEQLKIRSLFGSQETIIRDATSYLKTHPTDGDVRFLLGQLYFNEKNYTAAREELLAVLRQTPSYTDASIVLINVDLALDDKQEALNIVNMALLFNPIHPLLLEKKATLLKPTGIQNTSFLDTQTGALTDKKPSSENISQYKQLDKLYQTGEQKKAIEQAQIYLQTHPTDVDVRLILGKFYFNSAQYVKAQHELSIVLQQTPHYIDARLILINIALINHQYEEALTLTNTGLKLDASNKELTKKRKDTLLALHHKKNDIRFGKRSNPIIRTKNETNYRNEMGTFQQQYYISDIKKIWDYTSLYYGRETTLGKIYGKINYANRFSKQAVQGEIEAYPKLNKYIYLDLDFSFANQPILFPDTAYGAEAYVTLEKLVNFSLGGKYNNIDKNHHYSAYTGTLSKDFSANRLTFRPYYFVPGVGKNSLLYTLDLRHFIRDPYYYIGCILGAGKSPDLSDLNTVNFLVLDNKIINPYINFPLFNERLIINLAALYQKQTFPFSFNRIRNWSGGTLGLFWRF